MPISASVTGMYLSRIVVIVGYVAGVSCLVLMTSYLRAKNETALIQPRYIEQVKPSSPLALLDEAKPVKVPLGEVHRGVGKWAKLRRGSFIPAPPKIHHNSVPTVTKVNLESPPNTTKPTRHTMVRFGLMGKSASVSSARERIPIQPNIEREKTSISIKAIKNMTSTFGITSKLDQATTMGPAKQMHVTQSSTAGVRTQRLPNCLIIGARKAGTRALLRFLRIHPQIAAVGQELAFFSSDVYNNGLEWYRSQMPSVTPDKVVIEKCAEYFHSKDAFERVYATNKSMKIILIVREPFARMVSDYFFLQRYSVMSNSSYPFEELNHTLEELVYDNQTKSVRWYSGLNRSKYIKFFSNWLTRFPREQIHIVNGDSFSIDNPTYELQKVEKYLNIRPFFTEDSFYFNQTKRFWCSEKTGCLGEEKGHVKPTYAPELVQAVRQHLLPFNKQFYETVGTDFSWPTT